MMDNHQYPWPDYKGLTAGMAGMNLQSEPPPSAPPPTAPPPGATPPQPAPPTQVPPPYNPSVEQERPVLQAQASMPDLSYSGPSGQRGSESYERPPPYAPEAPSHSQSVPWGQRSSYPQIDTQFMSLPRQSPQGGSWGVPTSPPTSQGYAQTGATPGQSYPSAQGYQVRPQSYYQPPPPQGFQQQPSYGGQYQSGYYPPQQGPPYRGQPQAPARVQYVSPCRPNGYNIMELFLRGNILYLMPQSDLHRLPMRISDWGKVCGGGCFNSNNTKFEIVIRVEDRADWRVCLRNCEGGKYIYVNPKGEIKTKSKVKDDCDFHIRPVGNVESPVVCFESAANPGMFLNISQGTSVLNASKVAPSSKEAQFNIRAHRILNVYTSSLPLKAYGRISVINQIADRCTVQLKNKSSKLFLGIDLKGNIVEIQTDADQHGLFMVFDRGMGVVSFRSWKHPGYWLRVCNGMLVGKGLPYGLDADFSIKENYDGTVCMESIGFSNIFLAPPNSTCTDFNLIPVTVQQ